MSVAGAVATEIPGILKSLEERWSDSSSNDFKKKVERKDFFWDQLILYLSLMIASLTAVDVAIQFLRGASGGVACYTPYRDGNFTRDQASFVNSFCVRSLPWSQFFPVFTIVQGLLIAAPHYIWESVFKGQLEFFFKLAKDLDALRDSKTGDYDPKNLDIVKKLGVEFANRRIFLSYFVKLVIQLLVTLASAAISGVLFSDYTDFFICPSVKTEGWPLDTNVSCVYTRLQVILILYYADYVLVALVCCVFVYALLWCLSRHTNELGSIQIAYFTFTSCLTPDSYVFPSPWKSKNLTFKQRISLAFQPRVQNDLDFFVLLLFRADSGHGKVFRDLQIFATLKALLNEDEELLLLYIDAQQDASLAKKDTDESRHMKDIFYYFWRSGHSDQLDPKNILYINKSKTGGNPEHSKEFSDQFGNALGGFKLIKRKSIRDFFYYFVGCAPMNRVAVDIAFGGTGHFRELARAFRFVLNINFHPYYRDEDETCLKRKYVTNFCTTRVPEDLYSLDADSLAKFSEWQMFHFKQKGKRDVIDQRKIDFIVVGPITNKEKHITANLVLERLHVAKIMSSTCFLLTVRPLMIDYKDVSDTFIKYQPPKGLYAQDKRTECEPTCDNTPCEFEFVMYKYTAGEDQFAQRASAQETEIRLEPSNEDESIV